MELEEAFSDLNFNEEDFSYFQIAKPVPKDIFLEVTNEVIEAALFFFAPFGLPDLFRTAYTHEELFIQSYASQFQDTVECLSQAIYDEYEVTESEMAVAMHKYVEEQRDPEAMETLQRMLNALREVFSPPRVLELPAKMTQDQVEQMAIQFNPIQQNSLKVEEELNAPFSEISQGVENGSISQMQNGSSRISLPNAMHEQSTEQLQAACRTQGFQNMYPEVFGCLGFKLKPRKAYPSYSQGVNNRNPEKKSQAAKRWHKIKKSLSSVMDSSLKQNHVQAYVEFFLSTRKDEPDFQKCIRSASEKGFEKDYLFHFCKGLHKLDKTEAIGYLRLANQRRLEGDKKRASGVITHAIEKYQEAIRSGFGVCPDATLASNYASLAVCRLQRGNLEDESLSQKDIALALDLDPFCATAHQVQGQLKLMNGDLKGAVKDLVLGFDLQGGGSSLEMNEMANEAQIIELASRDAVREDALEFYLNKSDGLEEDFSPPSWLVESYLKSFSDEPDDLLKPNSPQDETTPDQDLNDIDEESAVPTPGTTKSQELYNSGILHKREKQYSLALKCFQDSLQTEENFETDEEKALALNQCATFLYLHGHMQKALTMLKMSVEFNPNFANSLLKVAGLLCDMDQKDEALEWFDKALDLGELADVYLHRGQLYLMKNEIRYAINDLKRAIGHYELQHGEGGVPALAYATLGVAMFKMDMGSPLRLRHIEKAYERYPENIEVLLFYGEILTQVGNFKKALELYQSAAAISPECPLPFVNAGRAYISLNDNGLAKAHFARAIQIDKFCSSAYLDLGQLLLNKGDDGGALGCYKKAAQCARYLSEVQEALACQTIAESHLWAQNFMRQ